MAAPFHKKYPLSTANQPPFNRFEPVVWGLAGGLLVGLAGLSVLASRAPLADDAFIFMRYAQHIAAGYGLVWNIDDPPVEGFTSFSQQMVYALLALARLPQVSPAPWLGVGWGLLTLFLTHRLLQYVNPAAPLSNGLALLWLALSPGVVAWSITGMETLLFTATLTGSAWSYLAFRLGRGTGWAAGLWFSLAALTRPEAIALLAATLLFDLAWSLRRGEGYFNRARLALALTFGVIYGGYYLWRWRYFGFPFPNTYYTKTGGGLVQLQGGLFYLYDSWRFAFGGNAGLLFALGLSLNWRKQTWARLYLLVLTATLLGVVALNGGDHFGGGRFITPLLPWLYALLSSGLRDGLVRLPFTAGPVVKTTALAALVALPLSSWWASAPYQTALVGWNSLGQTRPSAKTPAGWLPPAQANHGYAFTDWVAGFVVMGQSLQAFAAPTDSLAAVPVGAIGYYSQIRIIDMVGLTDPVIARQPFDPAYIATWRPGHDKGDGAYILSRQPTYIQLTDYLTAQPAPGPGDLALDYKSIAEIWAAPDFHAAYEFYPIQVVNGWYYNLYRRRDAFPSPGPPLPLNERLNLTELHRYQQWEHLFVRLRWQVVQPVARDYTVFVHLLNPAGERLAGVDRQPPRSLPTLAAGEHIIDDYMLALPSGLPSGVYPLQVGLYYFDAADGAITPVEGATVTLPEPVLIP